MFKKIAIIMTNRILASNAALEDRRSAFEYGFQLLLNAASNILIFFFIATVFHNVLPCVYYMIGFFVIRSLAGGFHASSPVKCCLLALVNQLIFIGVFNVVPRNNSRFLIAAMTLLIVLGLFIFAPVDHKNKPFYGTEYDRFRRYSRTYAWILPVLILPTLFIAGLEEIAFAYLYGSTLAVLSLIIAKLIRKREIVHNTSNLDVKK